MHTLFFGGGGGVGERGVGAEAAEVAEVNKVYYGLCENGELKNPIYSHRWLFLRNRHGKEDI